jgi:hypothetical protein
MLEIEPAKEVNKKNAKFPLVVRKIPIGQE